MGSDESKPLNMNISELCKKEEQNLPLNIRFVGRGSYGVVYAYKHDPDYVYKMYNTEELYSYDYKAYERINKYINDKIPEYKDLFAEYCGSVEQKSFKYITDLQLLSLTTDKIKVLEQERDKRKLEYED